MYLYPWEISDPGDFFTDYAATGCNAMAPALSYHHGNALVARTGRFTAIPEAALSFVPNRGLYGRLKPAVSAAAPVREGITKVLREWCQKTGRHFSGWVVLLHNSTLGQQHRDLCVENCFGDRYEYALCPSQPDVRDYTRALLADSIAQFAPDSLILESAAVKTAGHDGHHEIMNIRMTLALRWLWSLCFCPRCMEAAAKTDPGLDPEALRQQVRNLILRLANGEMVINQNEDAQIGMLLLENPGLYRYQQARQHSLGEFIGGISRQLRDAKTEFRLIPGAASFNVNQLYMEGFNLSGALGLADRLMPLIYGAGETYTPVRDTIRIFDPATPVGMGATLHPNRFPDKGSFLGAMTEARTAGCETLYLYNYSIASAARLAWVRELNGALPPC
jgi:hypothetical protein